MKHGGAPLNSTADFEFTLHDADVDGKQIGGVVGIDNVTVVNGLFTVVVNAGGEFGADAFKGEARFLAVAVRSPAGSGVFSPLDPRQPLTAAPYALALPALRIEQHPLTANIIGGHGNNNVTNGAFGATIGGGGEIAAVNVITGDFGTIAGGAGNGAEFRRNALRGPPAKPQLS